MIGALSARRRTGIANSPVTPTFTAPATMTSTNTLSGSGTFSFQFNSNKRTCTTNVTGSVSGSGASSFTYFSASDVIDPADYEVMVTLGSNSGFSNIATAGGSATLGVWITLSTSPLYSFSCSDRRGGSRPITVAIRHKVSTGTTASTNITMNQTSDAVSPTWGGSSGATTVIRTTTDSFLGIYIDSATAANAGQLRVYKNTTLFSQTGVTFSTGSIPESEYEVSAVCFVPTPSDGFLISDTFGAYYDVATLRAITPAWNSSTARYWSRLGTEPAATGKILVSVRHKFDNSKQDSRIFDFSAS